MRISVAEARRVAQETRGWPIGQRVRKVGWKMVSEKDLRDRFACDAIEKKQNELIRERLIRDFCAGSCATENPISLGEFSRKYVVRESPGAFRIFELEEAEKGRALQAPTALGSYDVVVDLRPIEQARRGILDGSIWEQIRGIYSEKLGGNPAPREAKRVRCQVRHEKLDEYLEEIPERVLESLQAARSCGLQKFSVAFPVLEEAPQPDPVLIAHLGDKMIEIDYWE